MDFLSQLNPQQREAVTETEGPLLILAGAGSGKTRVITYRIAYLIAEHGVAPHNILAVTFTNKAAGEMRERVERLLSSSRMGSAPLISTFHSLCVRILRQHIEALGEGYTRSFTIYDQDDSVRLIKACIKDLGYDDKQLGQRAVQGAISGAKNRNGDDAQSYSARVEYGDEKRTAIARVFRLYEERLRNNNALDFDDLLIKTVQLLRRVPEVREKYNDKFRYILVDEYQDTNSLQFALIRFLTEKQQNICVVGDEDQCVIEGTLVVCERGTVRAEDVKVGERVLTAKGGGRLDYRPVREKFKRKISAMPVVTIRTKQGHEVTTTPEHVHFADYDLRGDEIFFTYLMYKESMGYRVGVTRRYRSYSATTKTLGFKQRTNQENADAIWILESCDSEEKARFWEHYYASSFGLPTCIFKHVDGYSLRQESLNRLFSMLDTAGSARALLGAKNMLLEYPHHSPRCSTLKRRRNFSVTMCKDGRHGGGGHYCEVSGSDHADEELLRRAGLPVTAGKKDGWRIRVLSTDMAKIETLYRTVNRALGGVNLRRRAGFITGSFLSFTPASHVHPGMMVYVHTQRGIELDEVVAVEHWSYSGNVYDFNIDRTHNFVAGGIFTHNSVYRWRGADISNILNFEQHYPNARVIRLEQNYRSTQNILDAAGAVVKNNTERKGKNLWTANPSGERIRYYQAFDSEAEARFVAARIEEHRRAEPDLRAAVLYRTNAQSRVFEEALRRAGLPYNIVGGFSFYERAEVRDIISYLKLALNPHDSIALQRVINTPARGLGKQTLDEIARRAKDYGVSHWETIAIMTDKGEGLSPRANAALRNFQHIITELVRAATNPAATDTPVSDVVKAAILDTGYANALKTENSDEAEARLENLQELVNAAVDYDKQEQEGLRDFIDHAALVSDTDQYKRDAPVTLMTMHSAKGLEFPLVFIVGMEDGLFPHARAATAPEEMEEERRLCYVAITRAERFLYVTHAMKRRVYGEEMAAEPSQFLNEMPLDLMEDLSRGPSWLSFARNSSTLENRHAARALRGESREARERTKYAGKTYDSVDSIAEFFNKRSQQLGQSESGRRNTPIIERRAQSSGASNSAGGASSSSRSASSSKGGDFAPGSHVRHPKYGRGLVLRREGAGDSAKLTVSFPGFGQKKLIEKYAGLEKA
ncbi:MAG TPA: UvrD-helicase domain-containing protein [Pyrinomonadaceae bacterium]|jgi:DNA helicase-2/ATP-dependent DNA helicase PcrA|nr:UvrD-helicase domain-containing protein [Pyrinomonadaceae bacterium]